MMQDKKWLCLSLHHNKGNRFLYINCGKIYQLKAKDSEITAYPLRLGNKNGWNRYVYSLADYSNIDNDDILNIHKYLMTKYDIK